MVGAKRKLDTAHASPAQGASHSTNHAQNARVTRSTRSTASQATRGNDKNHNNTTPSRRSRIIKLNTRGALANNANPSNARETRTSRGRGAAPSSSQPEPAPSSQLPETPRVKRIKRGSVAEETPRTTRQSARLRGHDDSVEDQPLEPSPTKAALSSRIKAVDLDVLEDATPDEASPQIPKESDPDTDVLEEDPNPDSNPEPDPVEELSDARGNKTDASPPAVQSEIPPPLSPSASQKRKSSEAEGDVSAASANSSSTPSNKDLKLEEADLDRALEQQLQNGTEEKHYSQSAADATEESRADDESRQITDVEESTAPNGVESIVKSIAKGRSKTGGRTANRGKGKGRPRGKGVAGRRVGRVRQVDSPDFRPERSPSPFAAARKLLDRKSELDRAFKKVAAAQRLALHVMAVRTERQLARDKTAHQKVPEFEQLEAVLTAYRQRKQENLRHEYECQIEQENRLFNSEKGRIESKFHASVRHIQEEHLLAAQGDYMLFVEGRRAAEDDEHTETDGSETEPEKKPVTQRAKDFIRGFNSPYVREPAGAAAYERAEFGWENFVQRARLGEDIDPQMKEIGEPGPPAANRPAGTLEMLLEATGVVANQPTATKSAEFPPPMAAPEIPAVALSALADVASSKTPIRRPSIVHTILAQPPMADPRSYILPRPAPPPLPRQQPRPLLPAGQQIPSINEQLGLPDPFVPGGGPPQLPPPPGSNFLRPPPPGFLPGNPGLYFQHPRPPPGPRHPY